MNMNKQTATAITILALIVLAIGAWWLYNRNLAQDVSAIRDQIEWQFVDAGTAPETEVPRTQVLLTIADVPVEVGTYTGSCSEIDGTSWELLENEISGVVCYFAGGGTEIGIFQENGELVLKEGYIEEGTAEEPGFRGDFAPLVRPQPTPAQ